MAGRLGDHWDWALGAVGVAAGAVALVIEPHQARSSASQTWTPFVLVTGLLLVGLVAEGDGIFRAVGDRLGTLSQRELPFLLGAAVLISVVTATLNLDTSVVFVTPVLLAAAHRRGGGELPLLYGSLLLANAGSLYLPGSNLTNLIVLGHTASSGSAFLAEMWPAAVSATVVTVVVLGIWGRRRGPAAMRASAEPARVTGYLGAVAVIATIALVFAFAAPALPVFLVGVAVAGMRLCRGSLTVRRLHEVMALPVLIGLFGLAVAMGTLGRVWSGPSAALAHAGTVGTAVVAAVSSVLINNLPAAALLASRHSSHATALLVGLNLGPNLFVTGSLAWFLWLRIARAGGVSPSVRQASRLGVIIVPLSMAAALLALWVA